MNGIINEIATGLGGLMLKVFVIVVPMITFLEWAKNQRWFTRMVNSVDPLFRRVGFRQNALFPLLTGLIFGISYGAGVLIPQARSGELDPRQIFLVAAFLGICHALVEDTLLFVAVGASAWILPGTRFVLALIIVSALARLPWPSATPGAQTKSVS
jgi:hypothetical protein